MGSNSGARHYHAHAVLDLLSRAWTVEILLALAGNGPTRFGVLHRTIKGVSPRVLRERLRQLEAYDFVFRHYEPTIPPAVTYGVTKRIEDVQALLETLEQLSRKWQESRLGPLPNGEGRSFP
ncbi:MAG: winged helix-turn-helix transcriptional regulator [Terriglobales bacterium]